MADRIIPIPTPEIFHERQTGYRDPITGDFILNPPNPVLVPGTPIQPPGSSSSTITNAAARTRTLTFGGVGQCIPANFGTVQVGGDVIFARTIGGLCYIAAVIGRGPVSAIGNITIGGQSTKALGLVLNSTLFIHLGEANQTLDPLISGIEPEWKTALPGIAYVTYVLNIANPVAAQVDPKQLLVICNGLLVRNYVLDPTLVTRYFTDNPVWILADIMTSRRYGLGEKDANIDWAGSWTAAAAVCDIVIQTGITAPSTAPTVALDGITHAAGLTGGGQYSWQITFEDTTGIESLPGPATSVYVPLKQNEFAVLSAIEIGGAGVVARRVYRTQADGVTPRQLVKRIANNTTTTIVDNVADIFLGAFVNDLSTAVQFRLDIAMTQPQTAEQWIQEIRGQFQSFLVYNNGLYQLFIDTDNGIGSLVFDETTIGPAYPQLSSNGLLQIPTRVTVGFTNKLNKFKQDQAQDEDPNLSTPPIEPLRVEKRELKFQYYGIPSYDQAFRIAHWLLKRGQLDKSLTWRTNQLGTQPVPGTVCRVRFPAMKLWDQSDNTLGQPIVVTQCGPAADTLGWVITGEFYDPSIYDKTYRNPLGGGGGDGGPPPPPPPPPPQSDRILRAKFWIDHTPWPDTG